jgi:hypothetical protein
VIVVPANVTAFGAHTSGSYSIALRLNNLAILGPGAQLTTGHGVNASVVTGNYDLSTSRVLCMGLDKGVLLRNASAGYHFRLTCIGNKEGVSLGDSVFTPGDNTFADVNLQGNLTGLRIQNARNTLFVRGRIQANRDAIHMGAASPASPGAAGATALTFQQMQIDGNGAATSYWQSGSGNAGWDSGMANGRTLRLETHANNTYANIAAHNTNNSDSAVSIGGGEFHNDITIPHGTWAFHDCQLNSRGRFQGGEVRAKGRNSAGFTSIEVAATLNYEGPDADYVRNVATWAGGTVTHDWAVSGKKVNATLTADTTFEISTNAVTGATFSLQVSQGGAGNHKITWQNIKMLAGAWNERGSDTPGAAASAHFEYFGTTIGWCMVAHSNGYGDNTDTDLHRTIAIADYASYATIYFDTPEPDTNYEVSVNFVNSTGTPASSAFTTSITKRVEGFDVVLGAAPGASTSIVYAVDKYRAKPALNAITQFTSTTLMGTATSGGIAGSAAGWWVEALISLDSATFGQDHPLVGRGSYSGGSGWTIFAKRTGNDFSVALEVYTAVNTRVTSPAILINIRHVGKITHVVFVYDGTTLRTYHRGVQVGSGTTSAFTPATARMIVGNEGSANAAYYTNAVSVIGVQGSHHVPNLAQIQTHMTSVRTARALVEPAFAAALRRYRFDGRASVTNDATNAVSDPITVVSGTAPLTHAILCNQY